MRRESCHGLLGKEKTSPHKLSIDPWRSQSLSPGHISRSIAWSRLFLLELPLLPIRAGETVVTTAG